MISPEIWESQSFGNLSTLSKLIFVGLISLADDEGKGILSPQFVKSKLLPYDEKTRITDIQQSINEICTEMSIIAYEVGGKQYYKLTKWNEWQYIQKPTPSKIPNPPMCGVGGDIGSEAPVPNQYGNSTVIVPNQYGTEKEYEYEKEYEERDAHTREVLSSFTELGCVVDCKVPQDIDLQALIEKIKQSNYLKEWRFLSKYIAKSEKILAGYYDKYRKEASSVSGKLQPMLMRGTADIDEPVPFDPNMEV